MRLREITTLTESAADEIKESIFLPEELKWLQSHFTERLKIAQMPASKAALFTRWLSREATKSAKKNFQKGLGLNPKAVFEPGHRERYINKFIRYQQLNLPGDMPRKALGPGEDLPQIDKDLIDFLKYQNLLQEKDLMKIDYYELYNVLYAAREEAAKRAEEKTIVQPDEIEKYELSERWTVVHTKTHNATCKYGAGTRWCIASRQSGASAFETYSSEDDVYVIIDKKEKRKYAFVIKAGEFRDEADELINPLDVLGHQPELIEFFSDKFPDFSVGHIHFKRKNKFFYVQVDNIRYLADLFPDDSQEMAERILTGTLRLDMEDHQWKTTPSNAKDKISEENKNRIEKLYGDDALDYKMKGNDPELVKILSKANFAAMQFIMQKRAKDHLWKRLGPALGYKEGEIPEIETQTYTNQNGSKGESKIIPITAGAFVDLWVRNYEVNDMNNDEVWPPVEGELSDQYSTNYSYKAPPEGMEYFNKILSDELNKEESVEYLRKRRETAAV